MKVKLICLLLFIGYTAHSQEQIMPFDKAYKRNYTIARILEEKPVMDGRLDDSCWRDLGEWTEKFVQVAPYERRPSDSPTYAKLFYDNKYIYVGVYCKEANPERINRFIGNRDDNSVGDILSIAFDTYHDYRAAPEFNINVGGNKTDLIVTDKLQVNRSWNAVWEGCTHVDMADSSWTVEIRIPFSQLRYNRLSNKDSWGLHIRRVTRYKNETQNWSLIPLKNNGHVFSFGNMHGMKDLPRPRSIELVPYVMGKLQRSPKITGNPYQTGTKWGGNMGLDAKFALSDYTLDVTINPDFGQVELDPSVMNLTAYETFYDEKRPFFLEGKHIFDFTNGEDMMFYTRRIGAVPSYRPEGINDETSFAEQKNNVPILGALKLTGTNKDGLTIGLVQSITAQSSADVTRDGIEKQEQVEPLANYTVGRVQKNWNGNTLLGGMLTSVNRALHDDNLEKFMVRNAFTSGLDFTQYFKNRLYYIDVRGMYSLLEGSAESITARQRNTVHAYNRASSQEYLSVDTTLKRLTGTSGFVEIGRRGNARWNFTESFTWSSPGFDLNDMGYIKETDYMKNKTEVSFRQTSAWKSLRYTLFAASQTNYWNFGGFNYSNSATVQWKGLLTNNIGWDISETFRWKWYDSRMLRGGPDVRFDNTFITNVKLSTDNAKRLSFILRYNGSHNNETSNSFNTISPMLTLRAGRHVLLSGEMQYSNNTDNLQYVAHEADKYYMARMKQRTYGITLKMQLNFTPDLSLQFYGSPFTSTAKYDEFKLATNTKSSVYSDRFRTLQAEEITFLQPDFSFNEFRSNIVGRWEYLPGATLYVVWEHQMSNRENRTVYNWANNLNQMFSSPSYNTFMLKMNYWFSL